MKEGSITYHIEIPITIHYHYEPPERMTWDYPGSPGGIVVDDVDYPDSKVMDAIVDKEACSINEACREDLED